MGVNVLFLALLTLNCIAPVNDFGSILADSYLLHTSLLSVNYLPATISVSFGCSQLFVPVPHLEGANRAAAHQNIRNSSEIFVDSTWAA